MPGGVFAASNWMIAHDGEPSPEMKAYVAAEGLSFAMSQTTRFYRDVLGFTVEGETGFTSDNASQQLTGVGKAEVKRSRMNPVAEYRRNETSNDS